MTTALCITITGSLSAFVAEYKIELLIAFIGFAGTILGAVIQKAKKKISALSQKKLRKLISRKLEQAGSEPLFFETVTAKKEYQYYQKKIRIKNVPLFDASSGRKIGKVNESACSIIKGEAGIGKSILADNIFYRRNKRIRRWIFERLLKQYCLKISFQDLQNPELTELLSNAECRKLCLIIDGFDEASDDAGRVKQGIRALQKLCDANKVNLLLFGRTEFVDKSLKSFRELRTLFQTVYVLKQWDRQTLDLYSTNLINHYGKNLSPEERSDIREFLKSGAAAECIGLNPLRCKMVMYLCISGAPCNRLATLKEPYSLYTHFVTTLLDREMSRAVDAPSAGTTDQILMLHAKTAFQIYQSRLKPSGSQSPAYWIHPALRVLLNCGEQNSGIPQGYIHMTFEEYFVAKNFHLRLKEASVDSSESMIQLIKVLAVSYSNDYADFITSGFRLYSAGDTASIFPVLKYLYCQSCPSALPLGKAFPPSQRVRHAMEALDDGALLSLKYEIIFILGRINQNIAQDFIREVYASDILTDYKHRRYDAYHWAMLKRCCAISASLIGDEATEIDYVKKMIPGKTGYLPEYDLANRSHTLVYYNDVFSGNQFKDTDGSISWDNARERRMRRLRQIPQGAADKYTHFRAFDLATIYTFLVSRPDSASSFTEKDRNIIKQCSIDIDGISGSKKYVLKELKAGILDLFENTQK